jgi:hypothetical protein
MNAVYSQIWVALIISVLLWIRKTLEEITASVHQILQTHPPCSAFYAVSVKNPLTDSRGRIRDFVFS